MNAFTQFAAEEAATGGLLETLGIDWRLLAIQTVGFLLLVVLLGKFVYPVLIGVVDRRQAEIEAGTLAAQQAEQKAATASADVDALLAQARTDAAGIVATAREEAAAAVEDAETKARTRADALVASAHDQIEKDILAAKEALKNETIDLVARATETIVGSAGSKQLDESLLRSAVATAQEGR